MLHVLSDPPAKEILWCV